MIPHVAIISEVPDVTFESLKIFAAAMQIQVTRDLFPHWQTDATVRAYEHISQVPANSWLASIVRPGSYKPANLYGFHDYDRKTNLPYTKVKFQTEWTLVLSHEIMEMLVDPFGQTIITAIDWEGKPARFLVEVSDPSQQANYGYRINDVLMSDFYLPAFFDLTETPGEKYSFTGAIKKPKDILPGGYISFQRLGEWYQARNVGGKIIVKKLEDWAKQNPIKTVLLIAIILLILVRK